MAIIIFHPFIFSISISNSTTRPAPRPRIAPVPGEHHSIDFRRRWLFNKGYQTWRLYWEYLQTVVTQTFWSGGGDLIGFLQFWWIDQVPMGSWQAWVSLLTASETYIQSSANFCVHGKWKMEWATAKTKEVKHDDDNNNNNNNNNNENQWQTLKCWYLTTREACATYHSKKTPTCPGRRPRIPKPPNERNSFISSWLGVWGMFQGYVGVPWISCITTPIGLLLQVC